MSIHFIIGVQPRKQIHDSGIESQEFIFTSIIYNHQQHHTLPNYSISDFIYE